jgi:hypothetical protein
MTKWKHDPQTYRLSDSFCPVCFTRLDAATAMEEDHKPEPTDFTVCCYCASVLMFDGNMTLQLSSLMAIPEHSRMAFAQMVQTLTAHPWRRKDDGSTKIT